MDTCVLTPEDFSLVLMLHPNPRNVMEMSAVLWSNRVIPPGTTYHPNVGVVRLDKLEIYSDLDKADIRQEFGCYETVCTVNKREVRHCNWIRFLKSSTNIDEVNMVAVKVKGQPLFQTVRNIRPNEEIVVFFDVDEKKTEPEPEVVEANIKHECEKDEEDEEIIVDVVMEHDKTETDGTDNNITDSSGESKLEDNTSGHEDITDSSGTFSSISSLGDQSAHGNISDSTGTFSGISRLEDDHSALEDLSDSTGTFSADSRLDDHHPLHENDVSMPDDNSDVSHLHQLEDVKPLDLATVKPSSPDFVSPIRSAARGLLISPLARDDDCRSSAGDVTSAGEDNEQFNENKHDISPTSSISPEVRPLKRNRERTWLPCEVCGKCFDRPSLLKRHMRTHTGEKPHACDVCGKAFSTSSSLNTHRRIHSGEKPHQCSVCGKRFTASSNLYYHRMTHNKEKPHKCNLCSKSFPTPGDLRSHMYVHSGSWPFKCEICNRGFSKQTNLKNHLLLHTGDRPHECNLCGKRFALQCNLKTHLKTHDGDIQDECAGCGKMFLSSCAQTSNGFCIDCVTMSPPTNRTNDNVKSKGSRKPLSDFSISKLTDSENKNNKSHDSVVRSRASSIANITSPTMTSSPYGSPVYLSSPPMSRGHGLLSPTGSLQPCFPGMPTFSSPQTHLGSPISDTKNLPYFYKHQLYSDNRFAAYRNMSTPINPHRPVWPGMISHGY